MAMAVIDRLEPVEVEREDREGRIVALAYGTRDFLIEAAAVLQPGQRIVTREKRVLSLAALKGLHQR